MFVYLTDVPEELGPPHMLSRTHTGDLPVKPNWYPRGDVADGESGYVATQGRPDLYEAEISGAGATGTVIAFETGTFHRGTQLTAPRGVRYSMHLCFRPAAVQWADRLAPGPRTPSSRPGATSSNAPRRNNSNSSASRRPVTHSGRRGRWPAWRSAIPGSTSRRGVRSLAD